MTKLFATLWLGALLLVLQVSASAAIDARLGEAELECLALNVYWEGRSESREGRRAVAYVTLNRVHDPDFPDTPCKVVKQGEQARGACQFHWWCDGASDRPREPEAWRDAQEIARAVAADSTADPTRGALYFHNRSVSPDWASKRLRTSRIGQHIFYK